MSQETQKPLCPTRYCKRPDLNNLIRLRIAYQVLYSNDYGLVTKLAKKHNISCRFIYNLKEHLLLYCQESVEVTAPCTKSRTLSLRMEGKCSIQATSTLMKRELLPNSSIGYISEFLHKTGDLLGNKLPKLPSGGLRVIFCSDEIFSGGQPILITIDPISLTILAIDLCQTRKSGDWQNQWLGLGNQGVSPNLIAKDEGTAMKNAHSELYANVPVQSDTFHAIAHRLGLSGNRFEKQAWSAIAIEYEKERLLNNSKSKKTHQKREQEYTEAKKDSKSAIGLYEGFLFIYKELLAGFRLFDKQGHLKNKQIVMGDFEAALELGTLLENEALNKDFKAIDAIKTTLFTFYDTAWQIITELKKTYSPEILTQFCLAWQARKNFIKTKNAKVKSDYKTQEKELLVELEKLLKTNFKEYKAHIYKTLNQITQSSALVECINSILRPYLNTCKSQPTQQMLNLFMFYHNHRRFVRGERKGHTPMELLTGQKQTKDWLDLVLGKI